MKVIGYQHSRVKREVGRWVEEVEMMDKFLQLCFVRCLHFHPEQEERPGKYFILREWFEASEDGV